MREGARCKHACSPAAGRGIETSLGGRAVVVVTAVEGWQEGGRGACPDA